MGSGANRFSPLDQITTANVRGIWASRGSTRSIPSFGVEATPIVVDGMMYVTGGVDLISAIDARTDQNLWTFKLHGPRGEGYKLCCDVVNRGVAVYKGKVYVGTPERAPDRPRRESAGRLLVWSVDASADHRAPLHNHRRALRGPRGKSFSPSAAANWAFAAWSAHSMPEGRRTGMALVHRCRGNPSKPFENEAMATTSQDLGRQVQMVGERRRRNSSGHPVRGPEFEPPLSRHRQRRPLGVVD